MAEGRGRLCPLLREHVAVLLLRVAVPAAVAGTARLFPLRAVGGFA